MQADIHKEMSKEMDAHEVKTLMRGSTQPFKNQEISALIKVQSGNTLRNAEIIAFMKKQVSKLKSMGVSLLTKQKKYANLRKKAWMENDELNRVENQKEYEEDLRFYLLRFNRIRQQISKNFNKWERKSRKFADNTTSKLLVLEIKRIAKNLNKVHRKEIKVDNKSYWNTQVKIMREMDHKYMDDFEEDLKQANIQAAKFK